MLGDRSTLAHTGTNILAPQTRHGSRAGRMTNLRTYRTLYNTGLSRDAHVTRLRLMPRPESLKRDVVFSSVVSSFRSILPSPLLS